MAYLPELHYCCNCDVYLGPDNGDNICSECETLLCDYCDSMMLKSGGPDSWIANCPKCGFYVDGGE
jgi:hypothetical protein